MTIFKHYALVSSWCASSILKFIPLPMKHAPDWDGDIALYII